MASIKKRTTASGDTRWDVRWRVHGKAREATFTTSAAAEAHKRKQEGEELVGIVVDPRAGDVTFKEYSDRWLETRLVKGKPLSPMTLQGYRGLLRRHIGPTFDKAKLRKISPEHVRTWHTAVTNDAGSDQAAKAYRLLRAIMNTAIDDDRIGRNPCRIRGAGIEHAEERPMLETRTVLALAGAIDSKLHALVLLAGFGGLRTGELLGLQRRDIDELHGVVHIHRQAHEVVKVEGLDRGRVITGPKSEAGARTVALPRALMTAVSEHMAANTDTAADSPVFTSLKSRKPLRRSELSTEWRDAVDTVPEAPSGLHIHDLRHHAATTMARMPGVTTKELMSRIGHSSPRAALIYQHATEERDRAIADFLDEQIASAGAEDVATVTSLPG